MDTKLAAPVQPGKNPHLWFSRDSDAEGQFDPSMPWYERVRPLIEGVPPCTVALDIGCNSGGLGRCLTERGCWVIGVDLAHHFLPLAKKKGYVAVAQADAQALPFRRASFPVVILSEVLEHVPNPEQCLAEAARVLMPHGWLLGDVPHPLGKWGYRSIRGHKWHRTVWRRETLHSALSRWFRVDDISCRWGDWRAGYVVPQWMSFKAVRR